MALELAKAKLEGKFAFENLPADRSDTLWTEIATSFALTLEELCACKNERCKPQVLVDAQLRAEFQAFKNPPGDYASDPPVSPAPSPTLVTDVIHGQPRKVCEAAIEQKKIFQTLPFFLFEDSSLELRTLLRYAALFFQSTPIKELDYSYTNNNFEAREPEMQPQAEAIWRAAIGNQTGITAEKEIKGTPAPSEDIVLRVSGMKHGHAGELKKVIGKLIKGNKEGLGQLMQYAVRDVAAQPASEPGRQCFSVLHSLGHYVFAQILPINNMSIPTTFATEPFQLFSLAACTPEMEYLQDLLPSQPPQAFKHLVATVDSICHTSSVPIEQPEFRYTCLSTEAEKLNVAKLQFVCLSRRCLIFQHEGLVIKVAPQRTIESEMLVHSGVDTGSKRLRKMVGHGTLAGLPFVALYPFANVITKGFFMQNFDEAKACLDEMHARGYLHRDIKISQFFNSMIHKQLFLNDFDLSASQIDESNYGFPGGTPEFASFFLADDHTYDKNDDYVSLLLSYASCFCTHVERSDAFKKQQIQRLAERAMPGFCSTAVELAHQVLTLFLEQGDTKRRRLELETAL